MGFRNGAYATVWETKPGNGNWTDVRLSISRKNRDGEYETDFSGFVRFIGDAHTGAAYLGEKSRIKIGECDVTNRYDKEKKVEYVNYKVFGFEMADGSTPAANTTTPAPKKKAALAEEGEIDEDDLPF